MTSRIKLKYLAISGPQKSTARVDFSDRLTVIHGASDTGKSFILESIDYVLGAKSIRQIRELDGYTNLLVGLSDELGVQQTLSRSNGENRIYQWDGLAYQPRSGTQVTTLSAVHSSKDLGNISRKMLALVGMDEWNLTKNGLGETAPLSFRDVARVAISDETRMQAAIPPYESGNYNTRTKERSLVRAMLIGQSDPKSSKMSTKKHKEIKKSQSEVLDQLLNRLLSELSSYPPRGELTAQLKRVQATLSEITRGVRSYQERLSASESDLRKIELRLRDMSDRLSELSELQARFAILRAQYDDDLDRLDTINEASFVLTNLSDGPCVFCGSAPEDQKRGGHFHDENSILESSVNSERKRISTLLAGLLETISSIELESEVTARLLREERDVRDQARRKIQEVKEASHPLSDEYSEYLRKSGEIERLLGKFEQLEQIESFRAQAQSLEDSGSAIPSVNLTRLNELERQIRFILKEWCIDGSETARLDPVSFEISLQDRLRSNRGKGMRAILNAASIVGLAEFCLSNKLPHPGFVILDSPLVTYKGPKAASSSADEAISDGSIEAFYRYMDERFSGQSIVLENTDPGYGLVNGSVLEFTGSDQGIRGLIPRTS